MKTQRLAIAFISTALALSATSAVSHAVVTPKPVKEKGSFIGTFVGVPFSFDGAGQADLVTSLGRDNLGGPFMSQSISEFSDTSETCSLPDGKPGELFNLVDAISEANYSGTLSQLVSYSTSGSACLSLTTGFEVGSISSNVTGGSGKMTNAKGTLVSEFVTQILSALTAPGSGLFGTTLGKISGSVTR
ncbi:hypothetical protein IMX07_10510 [bacterium]|nr:hypothetical protein [bacterium]